MTAQYLTFFIGEAEYGLGILEAREIIQYPTVTKVPSMPAAIRGVLNLRGGVVPVLDLALLLELPERPRTKWTCVVVVESERQPIGIVVDSMGQVIELQPADIEPAPEFGTEVRRHFLKGMGKTPHAFVQLLDLARLIATVAFEPEAPDAVGLAAAAPAEAPAPPPVVAE